MVHRTRKGLWCGLSWMMKSLLVIASWGVHGMAGYANGSFNEIPSDPSRLNPDATIHRNAELLSETLSLSGCLVPAN